MNLRAEKTHLKKEVDKIEDEHLIRAIKELLKYAQLRDESRLLKPFTSKQVLKRAKASEKNIRESKLKTLESVRKEIANW